MKFKLVYTSDWKKLKSSREVELNSLEDLLNLQKQEDNYLILRDGETIEIYDDYRE